jgi:hypothetical protein|tara:strand:- start:36 stop:311 length:276 start_codon:yes stop_codon:yes gene_type:complete
MNIFKKADNIVNKRSSEKERQYGPFSEGMERAAKIASASTGKDITAEDMYLILVALKLSRESYNHKYDNILDAMSYLGGYYNYIKEKKNVK